jgi:hypothetical protein
VDASYTAGGSDGTPAKPWTTIGAAVNAAMPGAVIAVASGSYSESVAVSGKAVRLYGRCPSMVAIASTGPAAITLGTNADGTEVHAVALTGAGVGAALASASGVVLDAVWVHDTAGDGIDTTGSAMLRASLVERATGLGVWFGLGAADVSVEASVVRDTAPRVDGTHGYGIEAHAGSSLTVTGTVLERNRAVQLLILGGSGVLEGSVIRDALASQADGTGGSGVAAQSPAGRAALTLRSCTLERNATSAVAAYGSDVVVDDTLIRDTRSQASDRSQGYGIVAVPDSVSSQPAGVAVANSLIERSRTVGAFTSGGRLALDHCVVRDTLPQEGDRTRGLGVEAQSHAGTMPSGSLAITGSLIERNKDVGVAVLGVDATVDATLVRGTLPQDSDGLNGVGLEVQVDASGHRGTLKLTGSFVAGNRALGVGSFGADLAIDRSVLSSTGIGVVSGPQQPVARSTLEFTRSLIADSTGIGFVIADTDATISHTSIRGVAALSSNGSYGDGVGVSGEANVAVSSCRIENAARAGISMFGSAQVTLSGSTLACDAIPLDAEDQASFSQGGAPVVCVCGDSTAPCQVLSAQLQPPQAIAPAAP